MIYLLLFLLIVLLILNFKLNGKDIISPAFIFTAGFAFQAIWALLYASKWNLELHLNTFLVIFLGVLEFSLVCFVVKKMCKKKIKNTENNLMNKEEQIKKINTNKVVEVIILVACIIISGLYLYFVVKSVGGDFSSFEAITNALSKFDSNLKFTEEGVELPFIISNLELFVISAGYWFLYVTINNFFVNKKIDVIKILIILISILSSTLSGSRGTAFMMIVAAIFFFMYTLSKKKNYINVITPKLIRIILIIGIVFMASFYSFANLLGRNITGNKFDYLAIYCGAEVKNLDSFLQEENHKDNSILGSQTFVNAITSYGEKIGFKNYQEYKLDLPFREHEGFNLGNVYTTFYPFIYDFGYFGEFVLVLIMATISQLIYEYIKNSSNVDAPLISILVYGIIFGSLLLSFFSNKFYENIFSMGMLKNIVFWYLLNFAVCIFGYKKILLKIKKGDNSYEN